MSVPITPFECIAGTSVAFLARHRKVDGNWSTPGNTTAVRVVVTGDGDIGQTLAEDLEPNACLFATLQTDDPRWPLDVNEDDGEQGYNFRHIVGAAAFPRQGHYRVEFKLTDSDGHASKIVFEGPARSTST